MKHLTKLLLAPLVALAAFAALATPAAAAITTFTENTPPNIYLQCDGDATAASTFATTSYADLAGNVCTFTPHRNDPTGASLQGAGLSSSTTAFADQIEVLWTGDVTKATATTGTCAVYVNGAVVASSARTASSSGGEENLAWSGLLANATVGQQTVKVQCKSGDTNTFTVNNAHLTVLEVMRYPLTN